MNGDNLTYWRWILNQRKADLELEMNRELEDFNLIKLIKSNILQAQERIKELENV